MTLVVGGQQSDHDHVTQAKVRIDHDSLVFEFPQVHEDARFTLAFQRTLRIPDDDKVHSLPPGLGAFPLRNVDDYASAIPAKWAERGGVMLPMCQSERFGSRLAGARIHSP